MVKMTLSQTSFGHISINSSTILMVSTATESPQKDLTINALVLGSAEALFIPLRMSLKQPQGN